MAEGSRKRLEIVLGGAALFLLVLACYAPAIDGDYVWDDDAHVTRPGLRSAEGLERIWSELGATQQYYPLAHSVFWVESRLWPDSRSGHHGTSLLLHALSACLVWAILARLGFAPAWLAAAVFAVHPVHVESVAWISELKNTLSGALYLASMLLYLRFDENPRARDGRLYACSILVFLAALLAKTVTATLPAGLLVILWWKRGSLAWRRDVLPLGPFVALGAAAGLLTAWVERHYIGAVGADFDLSLLDRCLLAGRVFWFYLGKLLLPAPLLFIYPKWRIDSGTLLPYLFPAAAIALLVALTLAIRRIGRGPLAGAIFYGGTLFPVLGFFNVYPFKFSFVADHFVYLASLGVIAVCLGAAHSALASPPAVARFRTIAGVALLSVLALLSWRRAHLYDDALTLWTETTRGNPSSPMAFNNLGIELTKKGRFAEALSAYRTAIELEPDFAQAFFNEGKTLSRLGRNEEATEAYRKAIQADPRHVMAHNNLGSELGKVGRYADSEAEFRRAIELDPRLALFRFNLGLTLLGSGDLAGAVDAFEQTLSLDPGHAGACYNMGIALERMGRRSDAVAAYEAAALRDPDGEFGRLAAPQIRRLRGAAAGAP